MLYIYQWIFMNHIRHRWMTIGLLYKSVNNYSRSSHLISCNISLNLISLWTNLPKYQTDDWLKLAKWEKNVKVPDKLIHVMKILTLSVDVRTEWDRWFLTICPYHIHVLYIHCIELLLKLKLIMNLWAVLYMELKPDADCCLIVWKVILAWDLLGHL